MKKTMKQRVFALLMAVALILSNFTGITAKAENTPTYVVSIEETEHGSISFEKQKIVHSLLKKEAVFLSYWRLKKDI